MTRSDFVGLEWDWFAADALGYVAIFSSAGWGPVPDVIFATMDAQKEIAERLSTLCGVANISDLVFTDPNLLATRGIFAYDWHETFGPYRRIVFPLRPIAPEVLRSLPEPASLMQLPHLSFGRAAMIQESDIPSFTDVDTRKTRNQPPGPTR